MEHDDWSAEFGSRYLQTTPFQGCWKGMVVFQHSCGPNLGRANIFLSAQEEKPCGEHAIILPCLVYPIHPTAQRMVTMAVYHSCTHGEFRHRDRRLSLGGDWTNRKTSGGWSRVNLQFQIFEASTGNIRIYKEIPLKIHPKGSGPPFIRNGLWHWVHPAFRLRLMHLVPFPQSLDTQTRPVACKRHFASQQTCKFSMAKVQN